MTLTLSGKDVYYGSREIWTKLFKQFNLTAGKLLVKSIEFEQTDTPDVAKAVLLLVKAISSPMKLAIPPALSSH